MQVDVEVDDIDCSGMGGALPPPENPPHQKKDPFLI
jgi:hypothetical protein